MNEPPPILLRKVKNAVRTGRYPAAKAIDWEKNLRRDFTTLNGDSRGFDFTQKLTLITLEAEFLDLEQQSENAARLLGEFVGPPKEGGEPADFDLWFTKLPPRISGNSRAQAGTRRDEVRQMVWALLLHVWLTYYRTHDYLRALPLLDRVRSVIDSKVAMPGSKRGAGTLSRWYLVRAECLRGARRFAEAEDDLLQSQRHAHDRLNRELENPENALNTGKVENEIQFSTICTARILTFLGSAAVQQGRLTRGRQLLKAAETLVTATGARHTWLFVTTRSLIALRRHTPPTSLELADVLAALATKAEEYKKRGHTSGAFRCRTEIVRGYLDAAEFAADPPARGIALEKAKTELTAAKALCTNGDAVWLARLRFLSVKRHILLDELEEARVEWRHLVERDQLNHTRLRVDLFNALLLLREGKVEDSIGVLERLLPHSADDPVLEAECRLLLAECYATKEFNRPRAEAQLQAWSALRPVVENTYHAFVEKRIQAMLSRWTDDFVINFMHAPLNWEKNKATLRKWLKATARARLGEDATLEELSKLLGPKPSTLCRPPWKD